MPNNASGIPLFHHNLVGQPPVTCSECLGSSRATDCHVLGVSLPYSASLRTSECCEFLYCTKQVEDKCTPSKITKFADFRHRRCHLRPMRHKVSPRFDSLCASKKSDSRDIVIPEQSGRLSRAQDSSASLHMRMECLGVLYCKTYHQGERGVNQRETNFNEISSLWHHDCINPPFRAPAGVKFSSSAWRQSLTM